MSDSAESARTTVLLAAGDEARRLALRSALARSGSRLELIAADGAAGVIEGIGAKDVDALVIAEPLREGSGLELLEMVLRRRPGLTAVLLAEPASPEGAAEALGMGAADYLDWSETSLAKLPPLVGRAGRRAGGTGPALLSSIAHDLRAPLAGLLGLLDLMEGGADGPLQPAHRARLARIRATASRLAGIAGEISELARMEAGRAEAAMGPVDLREVIGRVWEEMEPGLRARAVELSLALPQDLPRAHGDPRRIRRLLGMLVSGLAARAAGSALRISVERKGEMLEVGLAESPRPLPVEAAGPGLDAAASPGDSDAAPLLAGGVSLSIARALAALHGGTLRLSDGSDGTRAAFTLKVSGPDHPRSSPRARPTHPAA